MTLNIDLIKNISFFINESIIYGDNSFGRNMIHIFQFHISNGLNSESLSFQSYLYRYGSTNQTYNKMINFLICSDIEQDLGEHAFFQSEFHTNQMLPDKNDIIAEYLYFSGKCRFYEVEYKYTGYFLGIWDTPHNFLQYHGIGNLTTIKGEQVAYALQGIALVNSDRTIFGNGIILFNTDTFEKLTMFGESVLYCNNWFEDRLVKEKCRGIGGLIIKDRNNTYN